MRIQASVAALLFVTSAAMLSCVVVDYCLGIFEQTVDLKLPQTDRLQNLENIILNQTDTQLIDQTIP
ncbi:MAG: hypothetical protein CW691_05745 [Candidatus Bathyarchaeum sp.]|nr:MAG: hypothetical protein CW691_05745 [Candidatus Bathyarchaeum sp.]